MFSPQNILKTVLQPQTFFSLVFSRNPFNEMFFQCCSKRRIILEFFLILWAENSYLNAHELGKEISLQNGS